MAVESWEGDVGTMNVMKRKGSITEGNHTKERWNSAVQNKCSYSNMSIWYCAAVSKTTLLLNFITQWIMVVRVRLLQVCKIALQRTCIYILYMHVHTCIISHRFTLISIEVDKIITLSASWRSPQILKGVSKCIFWHLYLISSLRGHMCILWKGYWLLTVYKANIGMTYMYIQQTASAPLQYTHSTIHKLLRVVIDLHM